MKAVCRDGLARKSLPIAVKRIGMAYSADASTRILAFGPFRLHPARRVLLEGDAPVRLGSRALDILITLVERPGEIVSKDELIARVWPNTVVEEANLRVHIGALRKVLGDGQSGARYVTSVPGRGYSFTPPVAQIDGQHRSEAALPAPESVHSLPALLTRMIGRAGVVRELAEQMVRRRFLTIVGPGGIGKTTVALGLAQSLAPSYRDGARFFDLASLANAELVPTAIASALGFQIRQDDAIGDLIATLRDRQMLLVLDNCEHVVDTMAMVAESIFSEAPRVHILASSREPLRAAGEWVFRLTALGCPPLSPLPSAAEALSYSAVQLFVERAVASLEAFVLTDDNAPAVADICRRVDGIPLAIELAAARVGFFGVQGLAARLDDQLSLLTKGLRTAVPRHQTLRATLDWSYHLLSRTEQTILCRLATFRGNFTLAAATDVAISPELGPTEVLDSLASLVAKSLITVDVSGETAHYRLLEITRAYGIEKLVQGEGHAPVSRRHAAYLCAIFEHAESDWQARTKAEWLGIYAIWIDDVRAALDWAFSPAGEPALGITLVADSAPLGFALSLTNEYIECAERALEKISSIASAHAELEMKICISLGAATFNARGAVPSIATTYARALEIAEQLGASVYQLRALWGLARERYVRGDYRNALAFSVRFGEVVETSRDVAAGLVHDRMMGLALHLVGRQAEALPYAERAINHPTEVIRTTHKSLHEYDNKVAARSHLARILWLLGFPDRAAALAEEGVAYGLSLEYPPQLCYILVYAACPIAIWSGNEPAAKRYVELLLAQSTSLSFGYWQSWRNCYEPVLTLGDDDGGEEFSRRALMLRAAATSPIYLDMLATLREGLVAPEAIARAESGDAGWCAPEILRSKAMTILRQGDRNAAAAAEAMLLQSLDLARQQKALSWELRTAISLARLWREQSRITQARKLFSAVHDRFTEGFATADLIKAKCLLDEMKSHPKAPVQARRSSPA
jgi:predicted ATPase/DNA-binding winged helix-turn-helix (wHTH) protein